MSYNITIQTNVEQVGADNVQLKIQFAVALSGTNQTLDAALQGITVADWGEIEWSYDLDDALLTPSTYQISLNDVNGYLDSMFFGIGSIPSATDKEAYVEVLINGCVAFGGYCLEDGIDSDTTTRIITLQCAPYSEVLNTTNLYKEYNGKTETLNPLNYTNGETVKITDILQSIFRLVDGDISYPESLEIFQAWNYSGIKWGFNAGGIESEIAFTDLKLNVTNLFFNSGAGVSTVGDLLRELAVEFGCFAGLAHQKKAFFKQLFIYDPNNTQAVTVLHRSKAYKYPVVNYVEVTAPACVNGTNSSIYGYAPNENAYTDCSNKYIQKAVITWASDILNFPTYMGNIFATCNESEPRYFRLPEGSLPNEGEQYSHNGSTYQVLNVYQQSTVSPFYTDITVERITGANDPLATGTLTQVSGSKVFNFSQWSTKTGDYQVGSFFIPGVTDELFQNTTLDAVAVYYYYNRGDITKLRLDTFTLRGISYDFLKDFTYQNEKFQPLKMTIQIAKGLTTCDALFLGLR